MGHFCKLCLDGLELSDQALRKEECQPPEPLELEQAQSVLDVGMWGTDEVVQQVPWAFVSS